MKYSSIPLAQSICTQCKNFGIQHIVISPGSRNAPLTLSFTADPYFKCYSIVDERSAAFFALGIAQQLKSPVALVCTSGSALLNYYPAIVEAYYRQIPLVVLSADRPSYLIDRGDGQTIRQDGVFFNHIGYQANLIQDASHSQERREKGLGLAAQSKAENELEQEEIAFNNKRQIKDALRSALKSQWPVHLNIPFEEPLYQLQEVALSDEQTEQVADQSQFSIDWKTVQSQWDSSEKILIIVGQCDREELSDQMIEYLAASDALVMTETTSNIHHPEFIERIDTLIAPIEQKNDQQLWTALQADLVVTIGGAIVSKKVKQFLRCFEPKRHWHWGRTKAKDTFFKLEQHFDTDLESIAPKFLKRTSSRSYKPSILSVYQKLIQSLDTYFDQLPYSDLWVHSELSKLDLSSTLVHYSNSASIRYAQLLPNQSCRQLYCNRGTSGIDGSNSTAVGASLYHEGLTLLVSGDLSFLYDINALWNKYLTKNLRIVVINNSGGGIFRILPTSIEDENFETYFETPHQVDINALCSAYGMSYHSANDKTSLKLELEDFLKPSSTAKLLEVKTPRTVNDKVLSDYFEYLTTRLS